MLCLFSIGTVLFVTLIDLEILYKVIFLSFSLLVAVIILIMVKRLYKQVDTQFQELTLIHDISTSLNLSLDHNVLYRV
ncbi:MAG: hypothetical protein ACOCV8_04405, partial [Spirochaetota bacterium]